MSTLAFTGDMAQLQQAIAESHDLVIRRSTVLEALNLRTGERVLEVGCGGGYYAREVAQFVGRADRVCAIDISPDQITAARARCADMAWVECREGDIAARSRRRSAPDPPMLRPGGRLSVVATDWSSAVWHSENALRMQRVLAAWAPHTPCRDLPAILTARLRRAPSSPCGRPRSRSSILPIIPRASATGSRE